MSAWLDVHARRRGRRGLVACLALLFLGALAAEADARGRGGGGGGFRGGGGYSRGGPARGGSIRGGGSLDRSDRNRGGQKQRRGDYAGTRGRDADRENRPNKVETRNGDDVYRKGRVIKTDDGFIARGVVVGEDGAAAGTIVRKGDKTAARGVKRQGDTVTWGGARCTGSRCYGGRVVVDRGDYYRHPYYYYPYYYGWYSCSPARVQVWYGRYGNPIYGCSNVVVVHTTISLGASAASPLKDSVTTADEARVSSAPVLMYETGPDSVVYGTAYRPEGVYSIEQGDRYYWAPGPAERSAEAEELNESAAAMEAPTANSTVITYAVGARIVYLTNEPPMAGYFSQKADQLHVWIPGVKTPTDADRALVERVIRAQKAGGQAALDREVRKLEVGKTPPPEPEESS